MRSIMPCRYFHSFSWIRYARDAAPALVCPLGCEYREAMVSSVMVSMGSSRSSFPW